MVIIFPKKHNLCKYILLESLVYRTTPTLKSQSPSRCSSIADPFRASSINMKVSDLFSLCPSGAQYLYFYHFTGFGCLLQAETPSYSSLYPQYLAQCLTHSVQ